MQELTLVQDLCLLSFQGFQLLIVGADFFPDSNSSAAFRLFHNLYARPNLLAWGTFLILK